MRRLYFHRVSSLLLLLMGLGAFADSGRADPLEPGSDPTGELALRGGQIAGVQLNALVYSAVPSARSQLAVKLDGVAQPSLTVQSFKEASVPLDVFAVLQIADWSRDPQSKELKKELIKELLRLADEVYSRGGRMGLVAYNRKLTCFPQEGGLDGSSKDFAGRISALEGFAAAEDGEGGHDTANALDCVFDRFGKADPGRARALVLFTDGTDKNDQTEQTAVFKRKAGLARQNSSSVITLLMPGRVQGSARYKQPFEQILSQSTGGHLIAVPPEQPLGNPVSVLLSEFANLLRVSGPLSLDGKAPAGQKHVLTLTVQTRALSREVTISPTPAAAAASPSGPISQSSPSSGAEATPTGATELAAPRLLRKWLSLTYALLALVGLAVFLGISLRKTTHIAVAQVGALSDPKVVLAAVPRRPNRMVAPSRAAEWMGWRADKLLAEGAAWLYSPRTRRTYLLSKLPIRLGNLPGSDIILRNRGPAAGCEFTRDPRTGRLVAQPLTEQSLEIEGQRISHATSLSDRIHLRIGGEEFQYFEVRTGVDRVA